MKDYGTVTISKRYDYELDRYAVHIDQADPRARIVEEFVINVDELRLPYIDCTAPGVLTIRDDYGQRFIYRIDFEDYDPTTRSYGMEWPD